MITDREVEEIKGLLRQILAAVKPRGEGDWRPIESAPKDGTRILLFDVSPHVGYWRASRVANKDLYPDSWVETGSRHRVDPTHWQPLPPAPKEMSP